MWQYVVIIGDGGLVLDVGVVTSGTPCAFKHEARQETAARTCSARESVLKLLDEFNPKA